MAARDDVTVPKEFVSRIPAHFARNYNLIGIGQCLPYLGQVFP